MPMPRPMQRKHSWRSRLEPTALRFAAGARIAPQMRTKIICPYRPPEIVLNNVCIRTPYKMRTHSGVRNKRESARVCVCVCGARARVCHCVRVCHRACTCVRAHQSDTRPPNPLSVFMMASVKLLLTNLRTMSGCEGERWLPNAACDTARTGKDSG